jgi:hypothetical protein
VQFGPLDLVELSVQVILHQVVPEPVTRDATSLHLLQANRRDESPLLLERPAQVSNDFTPVEPRDLGNDVRDELLALHRGRSQGRSLHWRQAHHATLDHAGDPRWQRMPVDRAGLAEFTLL